MEPLKHECGIALIRLRKPLEYYAEHYGTTLYGLNKLYLLMEKQHNRGQDGAGLAVVKTQAPPGDEYIYRERALGSNAITEIFKKVHETIAMAHDGTTPTVEQATQAERYTPFLGDCYMGHLRYSTTDLAGLTFVHPMVRRSNWRAKSLAVCGNFNLTNVSGIFDEITAIGQHPRTSSDTHIILDQVGHRLDREVERLYKIAHEEQGLEGMDITHFIEDNLDLTNVLHRTSPIWDGGFVMCGMTGSGDSFVLRDRNGIRPAFYYIDDEIIVVASERPVIQTVMNVTYDKVLELNPGEALTIDNKANPRITQILEPGELKACSFERIYFSRGSDRDIYRERKMLGQLLTPAILREIDGDLTHSVFSFIPNTAEVAYFGMLEGLNLELNKRKAEQIEQALGAPDFDAQLKHILSQRIRSEKVAIKDIKLRTFISEGNTRNDLATHVYDVTYGSIERGVDNLVVIDDSIVRGTTIRQSILTILDRLGPRKIVFVSSAPQIRYPDYYGIDMRHVDEFIAFRAMIALLQERGLQRMLDEAYREAIALRERPLTGYVPNVIKSLYAPFTEEEISAKIAELVKSDGIKAEVSIVYQTVETLHEAIPHHPGDWYFTGDYPTPGGSHLVNDAFIAYYEQQYNRK